MTTRGRQARFLRWATPLGLLLSAASGWALSSSPPPTPPLVSLAAEGRPLWPFIIATNATPRIRAAASNLVHDLSRITGQPFACEERSQGPGIRVGLFASFSDRFALPPFEATPFTRETYLLRSTSEGLLLLGATDLAVEHAVWDLLDRLGYRQFFPGPVWEIVPRVPDLTIAVDTLQAPAFLARRIWYNWGLGGYNRQPYAEWCARNRMPKGFDLNNGHSYETIVATFRSEFDVHPDYFALVGDWAQRVAAWAPRMSGVPKDADGNVCPDFAYAGRGFVGSPRSAGARWAALEVRAHAGDSAARHSAALFRPYGQRTPVAP